MKKSDFKKMIEQQKDCFSFPDGIYLEQNELEWEGSMLSQKLSRKTKMLLQMYRRLTDRYVLLYEKELSQPLSLSEKLDVKYIYHISAQSVKVKTISAYRNNSASSLVRLEHMERDKELRNKLAQKEREFEARADNYERFQHDSYYTNEERMIRGEMSREAYYDESLNREYRKFAATEKAQDAVIGNMKAMHYNWAQTSGNEHASRRRMTEENERIRMMSVGEAVYRNGELIALVLYKGPQEVREIRCAHAVNLEYLEGRLLTDTVVMERNVDYEPLLSAVEQMYGPQILE